MNWDEYDQQVINDALRWWRRRVWIRIVLLLQDRSLAHAGRDVDNFPANWV